MWLLFRRQDWILNVTLIFLAAASLTILYSIAPEFFWRQLFWFLGAFAIIFIFILVDWRSLTAYRWLVISFYAASLLLLIATLIFAPTIRGTRSWLVIGPVNLQASEFAKAALIFILAYFFMRRHREIARFSNILKSFLYFILPAALIMIQPDFGSMLVLFSIWLGFLLVSGLPLKYIVIGCLILAVIGFGVWNYLLKDYHKERIKGLFNPEYDPLGINYSVIQAKIAIGSAGFLGKGFRQGTQVQLGFLPEAQSDFVFAAFVEEWGLLGGLVVIVAFILAVWRLIRLGLLAENNFGRLVCFGTAIMLFTHFTFNIGFNLGLLPVIGVPFPFLSYGGSNLLTNAILIGIIQSIAARTSFLRVSDQSES